MPLTGVQAVYGETLVDAYQRLEEAAERHDERPLWETLTIRKRKHRPWQKSVLFYKISRLFMRAGVTVVVVRAPDDPWSSR